VNNLWKGKVRACMVVLGLVVLCFGCASEPVAKQEEPPPAPVVPVAKEPVATTPARPAAPVELPKAMPQEKEPSKEVSYVVHTVKWRGETLSMIAAWYTGKSTNWKAVAEVNPDIKPSRIFEGNVVRIPEAMVKTRDPMPKGYVDRFYKSGKNQDPAKTPPSQRNEDDPPLFGPKASLGK